MSIEEDGLDDLYCTPIIQFDGIYSVATPNNLTNHVKIAVQERASSKTPTLRSNDCFSTKFERSVRSSRLNFEPAVKFLAIFDMYGVTGAYFDL